MAEAKQAKVLSKEKLNERTCRVFCEMVSPVELGFTGGQYIIVNSKQMLASGKLGKRAYSIPTADSDQKKFELIVRRIHDGEGIGSKFIHDLNPGEFFEFSGPWGKYLPPAEPGNGGKLIIATETGITAALGLVRGKQFASYLPKSKVVWRVESDSYFIPSDLVKQWLPRELGEFETIKETPDVDAENFDQIYLSGDGLALSRMKDRFVEDGYNKDHIVMETFFNHLERKASV